MAISTYAELQTAVASWAHRSDLTSIIPDLILVAEKRIYRTLRIRKMETALSSTISSGVISVPSDYLALKSAYVDGSPTSPLSRSSVQKIYEDYPTRSADGKPVLIAREGTSFIFGPYPDSGYTIKGIYYALPTSIQTSANAVFTANPDLYLFASMCEAARYVKDKEMLAYWETQLTQVMADLDAESDDEMASGSGLAVKAS
jgi:hypothetical protein